MTPSASIRRFEAPEWRLLRALRLAALADAPDAFARTLAEEELRSDEEWERMQQATASSPAELSLVAELEGRAVGLVYSRLDRAGEAQLNAMWVEPAARGHGVGAALVEAVLAWARSRAARSVSLEVTEGNAPALRLYQRAGFYRGGESSPLRPGSPLRTLPMRLSLEPPAVA